jgi:hypothetical protein
VLDDARAMVVLVRGETVVGCWPLAEVAGATGAAGAARATGAAGAAGADAAGADLSMVDGLARLQLAARRLGCSIRLRDGGGGLWELVELAGLAGVVTADVGRLVVEVGGEPESGEEPGVKEGVEPADPLT